MTTLKKSEITKDALLKEGMQQLAENGYHGTGIKKVLDAVKVPKGSFYNYFASKEAYVSDIIGAYNADALAMFDAFVAQSDAPALQKMKTIYQYMLSKFEKEQCQQGCLIGSIAAEIGHSFELCQHVMQVGVNDWQTRIAQLLTEAQKQGDIRDDLPAQDLAELLWSAWEGSLIKMKLDGSIKPPQKMINLMLEQLLIPEK